MHISPIQSYSNNVYYNNRTRFGNAAPSAKIIQKAEPLTLTIAGKTYTGATTIEVVSRYLTDKVGRNRFHFHNANYDINSEEYDPIDDEYPLEFNFNIDLADPLGFEIVHITEDIVKATGNSLSDDTIKIFDTVGDAVDFIDSHRHIN